MSVAGLPVGHLPVDDIFFDFSVLPSFEVKLTTERPFFYVDDQTFTVNIKAT